MNEKLIAIIAIATLGITALILGANHEVLYVAITGIAGLAGYSIGKPT